MLLPAVDLILKSTEVCCVPRDSSVLLPFSGFLFALCPVFAPGHGVPGSRQEWQCRAAVRWSFFAVKGMDKRKSVHWRMPARQDFPAECDVRRGEVLLFHYKKTGRTNQVTCETVHGKYIAEKEKKLFIL